MENYLFCRNSLAKLIKKINRTSEISYDKKCTEFQEELCQRLKRMLFYACKKEYKPEIFPPGLKILGSDSNIANFTINNNYLPEINKIDEFIENNHLKDVDISDIEKLFEDKNLFCFLNGHFITFSIFTFINSKISKGKMKLGKEMLYNFLYDYCPNCTNKCSDFINVVNQLQTAINKKIE